MFNEGTSIHPSQILGGFSEGEAVKVEGQKMPRKRGVGGGFLFRGKDMFFFVARWWFQKIFISTPTWGRFPI